MIVKNFVKNYSTPIFLLFFPDTADNNLSENLVYLRKQKSLDMSNKSYLWRTLKNILEIQISFSSNFDNYYLAV